jgi:branched-chain amino acid transport system substrate-binding protein
MSKKGFLMFFVLVALAVGLMAFAGCGGRSRNDDGNVFRIGGSGPLTGGAAQFGIAVRNGAQLAVDEVNALGGIQFLLNFQDDEHDQEKAVNAYNILKDWGVQISMATVTSNPGRVVVPMAFEDRLFGMTPSASSTDITDGNDNIFQMCFTDPAQGTSSAQYIFNNNLGRRIAIIYKNDDVYSSGIYYTFVARAQELGLEVVSTTTFTTDSQTDFSVQLAAAQNSGADLVFLPIYYTPASLIFNQADAMGFRPTFFGVDGMDGILTMEGFDARLAEGVILLTPFSADASDTLTVNFVRNFQERFGEIPNQFAAGAYDVIWAFYRAIQASNGAITPAMSAAEICEKLIAIFVGDFVFDGVTGVGMTWDAGGAVTKTPKAVVIRNGVYVGLD